MSLRTRVLAAVLAIACVPPANSQGLSFVDAVDQASRTAPVIEAGTARVDAAQQAARAAGRLPDPQLLLGIDNLPVEGPDQYSLTRDFMTMQRVGVMQDVPNRAKRAAERALASGEVQTARSKLLLAQRDAAERAAVAWITRYSLERQLVQLDALVTENRLLEGAVRERIAAGQALPVEALAVRQEEAALATRRDALFARREQAIASLREWIGPAADAPLTGGVPELHSEGAALLPDIEQHPAIAELDAEAEVRDARIAAARAATRPDWSFGLMYQKRGAAFGDMVSLQVGVGLPLFRSSRQAPRIEASRLDRRALDAEREARLREHQRMLEEQLAEERLLRQQLQRQREQVLPLAEQKVALTRAAWSANRTELADLLAARRERLEAGLELLGLEGAQWALMASLHFQYGDFEGDQP